jgi:hypothetical protein
MGTSIEGLSAGRVDTACRGPLPDFLREVQALGVAPDLLHHHHVAVVSATRERQLAEAEIAERRRVQGVAAPTVGSSKAVGRLTVGHLNAEAVVDSRAQRAVDLLWPEPQDVAGDIQ